MRTIDDLISGANKGYKHLLDIIENSVFLSKHYQLQTGESLISDPERAAFYATDQDIEPPYQYWTHILESHEIYYTDFKNTLSDKGKKIDAIRHDLTMRLIQALEVKAETKALPEFMLDVMCSDFEVFLHQLTFDQSLAPFNANLLRIYREGGFPCGWKGEFPKGEQLVYVHHS
jgi:hypothetical protein